MESKKCLWKLITDKLLNSTELNDYASKCKYDCDGYDDTCDRNSNLDIYKKLINPKNSIIS